MSKLQVAYKFKLRPKQGQVELLEDWQHKVGYIQNRSLGDRIVSYNNTFVMGDYCDLYTQREISTLNLYCDINLYSINCIPNIVSPLHCSVSKSASFGNIWKEDKPSLRRSKDKEKPFNPKRSTYEMHSNWITEFKQANPEFKNVNADAIQQALRHVDGAFNKFFSGKAGFPNFKQHIDVSFEFKPGTVRIINKYIIFPTLGGMRFFKSREIPPSWEIRTVTISREVDGWYVSVLLRDETVPDLPIKCLEECESIQGVDVGIKKLASLSDGTLISNPQFLKKSERRLRIRQRRVSRKQKGSRKRKKAAIQLSRLHQKIRRQREDYQWKQAKIIGAKADITVFEDLNIKGMKSRCKPKKDEATGKYLKNGQAAKAALNQAISDASWYSLRQKTEHQAQKLGNLIILVHPKNTSITCPECGHTSKSNRDKEKFVCENCSHCDDADVNGAINIAKKARTNLGLDTLQVDSLKVTPKNTKESSFSLGDEPGNPANSTAKQLRCVTVKSVKVKKERVRNKHKSSQPEPPEIGIQRDKFTSLDGDDGELARTDSSESVPILQGSWAR
ncbi:transposase, IS605 OrfB family protein [Calothrix sp. NIES-4071]|nr:transposase, IS605 OrfB family protein [Calothrix sp. NIES-4071]BAZ63541.1 transposase, IS605 OrfB family protein [Calothrix sp. NIES-4105]